MLAASSADNFDPGQDGGASVRFASAAEAPVEIRMQLPDDTHTAEVPVAAESMPAAARIAGGYAWVVDSPALF